MESLFTYVVSTVLLMLFAARVLSSKKRMKLAGGALVNLGIAAALIALISWGIPLEESFEHTVNEWNLLARFCYGIVMSGMLTLTFVSAFVLVLGGMGGILVSLVGSESDFPEE